MYIVSLILQALTLNLEQSLHLFEGVSGLLFLANDHRRRWDHLNHLWGLRLELLVVYWVQQFLALGVQQHLVHIWAL